MMMMMMIFLLKHIFQVQKVFKIKNQKYINSIY